MDEDAKLADDSAEINAGEPAKVMFNEELMEKRDKEFKTRVTVLAEFATEPMEGHLPEEHKGSALKNLLHYVGISSWFSGAAE